MALPPCSRAKLKRHVVLAHSVFINSVFAECLLCVRMELDSGSTAVSKIKVSALGQLIFQWEKSDNQTTHFRL